MAPRKKATKATPVAAADPAAAPTAAAPAAAARPAAPGSGESATQRALKKLGLVRDIDFALYLPSTWAEDEARRRASRIPDEVGFATKIELAIERMDRAFKKGIPGDVVLADAAYGSSGPFREYVLSLGKHFACGIQGDCLLHLLTRQGRRHGEPRKASDIANDVGRKAFRRVTYRNGSKGKMASYFCLRRVKVAGPGEPSDARNTPLWLVMEWPEGEERPTKLALTSLGASLSKREIVRVLKRRWQLARKAAGKPYDKPNLIMSSAVQVCWEKFCNYFDVEMRLIPTTDEHPLFDGTGLEEVVDENTIGVVVLMGHIVSPAGAAPCERRMTTLICCAGYHPAGIARCG